LRLLHGMEANSSFGVITIILAVVVFVILLAVAILVIVLIIIVVLVILIALRQEVLQRVGPHVVLDDLRNVVGTGVQIVGEPAEEGARRAARRRR